MQEFHTVYMKVAVTVNRLNLHERLVFKASMAYKLGMNFHTLLMKRVKIKAIHLIW